jgi:hypothetical protein
MLCDTYFSLFCGLYTVTVHGQKIIPVPKGSAVMIDGKLEPGEWSDARKTAFLNGAVLYSKLHEHFLLLAIVFPQGKYGFTDLFMDHDLDLHASAKLGERRQNPNGTWPEWTWWNNDRWTANVSRVEEFTGPKLMAENVREYQIDLKRFPKKEIGIEVVCTILSGNEAQGEWRSGPLLLKFIKP